MPKKPNQPIKRKSSVAIPHPPIAPRRIRLSKKQLAFFRTVFGEGYTVEQALDITATPRRTFHRWLASPIFMRELQTNLERCYIQARIEMIRSFPDAIKTVLKITDKLMRPEDFRRLCSELIRLYSDFNRMERSTKHLPRGVEPARFDVLMEQCGVKLSPGGVIEAPSGVTQITQKPVFQLENPENTSVPQLSAKIRGISSHKSKASPE